MKTLRPVESLVRGGELSSVVNPAPTLDLLASGLTIATTQVTYVIRNPPPFFESKPPVTYWWDYQARAKKLKTSRQFRAVCYDIMRLNLHEDP